MTDHAAAGAIVVRAVREQDLAAVAALNAANTPAVGPLDDERIELFLAHGTWLVGARGTEIVATFVGLREGCDYTSPNYRWFAERHDRFGYVDRIALATGVRGTGLADRFYERWIGQASADGVPVVCAEVNVRPANPRSLAFHHRHGFVAVAEEERDGGAGRVALLERPVPPMQTALPTDD